VNVNSATADVAVDARLPQRQGSISLGGASLAAVVGVVGGAVASHCIEQFDTDEGSSVAEDGEEC
jgi:hypothetical protein